MATSTDPAAWEARPAEDLATLAAILKEAAGGN